MFELSPFRKGSGREMTRFRRELDDLFTRFFDMDFPGIRDIFGEGRWQPRVNVSEAEKEIVVTAEIPGITAKEIDIQLEGRTLTIKGEKTKDIDEQKENLHRVERAYGYFARAIELPAAVDSDQVDANYKKGILTIKLPKTKASESKKIAIKGA